MLVALSVLQDVLYIFLLQKVKGEKIISGGHIYKNTFTKHTYILLLIRNTVFATMLSIYFFITKCFFGGERRGK